ncbi:hypothetical protein FACS1894189_6290 [Planctomycetales bacterium]|nr:hypothetical protein FACS1894189_6290 [Planctomycetales bacterium]
MSTQQIPMSFEQLMQSFQESRQEMKERAEQFARELKEYKQAREQERKEWNRRFSEFSDRIGEIIEAMVAGDILTKFDKFGYNFTECNRRHEFRNNKLDIHGEIDLFLEDGDTAMLVEVKAKLEVEDVRRHIFRLEKFRRYADAKGDKRHFVAAVAGAAVSMNTIEFAHENGLYVIVQSGEAVKILKPPKSFKVAVW